MRRTCILLLAIFLCVPLKAADVEFVRVWPGWRDANSFRRISEYFDGIEITDGKIILRSQPKSRSGYYFYVRVKHPTYSLKGAHFSVQYITPYWLEAREKTFSVNEDSGEHQYLLGLTGSDWTGHETHPIAWKVDLVGADGKVIATAQSFLWSKPPAHG
jgi:hypothetical protein